MPRPKTRSDEDVLDAALALLRDGRLTFATLAEASGLSGATLVQRFGSKDGLRQRALLRAWDHLDARTAELAAQPIDAIELLVGLSGQYDEIEQYAENLMILREDLRDPVLRARGAAWEIELSRRSTRAAATGRARCSPRTGRARSRGGRSGRTQRLDDHLRESLGRLVKLLPASG